MVFQGCPVLGSRYWNAAGTVSSSIPGTVVVSGVPMALIPLYWQIPQFHIVLDTEPASSILTPPLPELPSSEGRGIQHFLTSMSSEVLHYFCASVACPPCVTLTDHLLSCAVPVSITGVCNSGMSLQLCRLAWTAPVPPLDAQNPLFSTACRGFNPFFVDTGHGAAHFVPKPLA